jgi:FlaA1/EpsC-like NDP-sugar epimerase
MGDNLYSGPKRFLRHAGIAAIYALLAAASLLFAYLLRFDFVLAEEDLRNLARCLPWVLALQLCALACFGQFGNLLTYFSVPDLKRIVASSACVGAVLAVVWHLTGGAYVPPRGAIVADAVFFVVSLCAFRFLLRLWREQGSFLTSASEFKLEEVAIIGAGTAGAHLAKDLLSRRGLGLEPVVFLDDDREKWGAKVHGIPVMGDPAWLLSRAAPKRLRRIIIAMPSAPATRIAAITEQLKGHGFRLDTVPALDELLDGKYALTTLRPVRIEDLLGREVARLDSDEIRQMLAGQVVAVTGAGGSIGSELCRQIVRYHPKSLLLIERCESQLFQIEQELVAAGCKHFIVPLITNICDEERMNAVLAEHQPQILFHAAAHKHVPMMEGQPEEAIKNNALGTAQLARLALKHQVRKFVLISSDKAINPTNVMGATKRMAEMFLQAFQAADSKGTRFISVRFGNVLGSSGSVVPIFEKQIAAGGPVRVTHPDITRYFMTIPEAVVLVLQSGSMGQGGEIFLLDMGSPVRIVDLARRMIELHGLRPEQDIAIEFTGLRPGEKLFEELNYSAEKSHPTRHPKVFRLSTQAPDYKRVANLLMALEFHLGCTSANQLKERMVRLVQEYTPELGPEKRPGRRIPAVVKEIFAPDTELMVA